MHLKELQVQKEFVEYSLKVLMKDVKDSVAIFTQHLRSYNFNAYHLREVIKC